MKCHCLAVVSCALALSCEAREDLRNKVFPIADEIRRDMNVRLVTCDPGKGLHRYVDYLANGRQGRFVANPDFWAKGIDFSCVSPWNSQEGQCRAGTAISARHIVFASHYAITNGTEITFVGNDGGVVRRRLARCMQVGDSDIMVGLLDADLPPTIRPAYVMPRDCTKHIGYGNIIPVVVFDKEEKALVRDIPYFCHGPNIRQLMRKSRDGVRMRFYEDIESGDCGDPAFIVVRNGVILLTMVQYATGLGHSVFVLREEIQRAMDRLMHGYKLKEYDFVAQYGK